MSYLAIPSAPPTRVTLRDAGGSPVARWTLQAVSREGRAVRWLPEGVLRQLGSGAAMVHSWAHRGFRLSLGLQWSHGLMSSREVWAGGAWSSQGEIPTAAAHSEILGSGEVLVEPFVGSEFPSFLARAFEQGVSLQDTKGVAHPSLELDLVAVGLVQGVTFRALLGWGTGPWSFLPWGD